MAREKRAERSVTISPQCKSLIIILVGACVIAIGLSPGRGSHSIWDDDPDGGDGLRMERVLEEVAEETAKPSNLFVDGRVKGGDTSHDDDDDSSHLDMKRVEEVAKEEEAAGERARAARRAKEMEERAGSQQTSTGNHAIHVMLTSNGSPYMNWQTRIMYHSYKKVLEMPGNDMKHFTRVLHRMKPDGLMDDVNTLRVDPLDPKCDDWCEYPVASRPWAIQQWLDSGDVKADWILMIETDYIFVKPVSIPTSGRAIGFPFGYIIPTYPTIHDVMTRLYPDGKLEDIPPTGNAPVLMRVEDMRKVVPIWVKLTAQIEEDADAKEKLGWVREMYAFSIATALAKVSIDLPVVPDSIMVQPPADSVIGQAAILHYTWGTQYKDDKEVVIWEWDKRKWNYDKGLPPVIKPPPEGRAPEAVLRLLEGLNDAITSLPKFSRGELIEDGKDPNAPENLKPQVPEWEEEQPKPAEEVKHKPKKIKKKSHAAEEGAPLDDAIHVMLTSNGSPYMNWQTKLMYHSYQKVQSMPGNDMKHFTRVLHRMTGDDMMDELHTVRVDPLDPTCDTWCEYPVASRPNAIQQWLDSGDVKGSWVLMIETDYLFTKPMSIPADGQNIGFPFGYIVPTDPGIAEVMRKHYPSGKFHEVPATGNAPVLIKVEDLRKVVAIWVKVTADIEADPDSKERLGWVREMYAYSIAMALAGVSINLPLVPHAIMVQPPADAILGDAAIIHYTWGSVIKDDAGNKVWEWDKRYYTENKLPPHVADPPEGKASELQLLMVKILNEGIDDLTPKQAVSL